jgi:TrmH family RNA methyltransferase
MPDSKKQWDLVNYGMAEWKDNIYFVLVEPKEPGNIGAAARAIKNMGFTNLCLVKPPREMTDEGRWFARNAHDVLDAARVYATVADAIKNKALVIGTTRRLGKRRGVIMAVEQGAKMVFERASHNNKTAILFGREARGLFNEEVEECGFMLTIPSSKIQPSLNLSQAVLITAYELSKAEYSLQGREPESPFSPDAQSSLVRHEELSTLYGRISEVLQLLQYIPTGDKNIERKIMNNLKHFIGRTGLTEWELKMLQGLCTQIEKKAGKS